MRLLSLKVLSSIKSAVELVSLKYKSSLHCSSNKKCRLIFVVFC
ncbi:hypothetical protein QG041_07195 [Kingella kingae]|nr:hypothetical protein [Kingella kingae]MDK4569107.1 hypothetical protein [Kingella kingae]MDK4571063.1 hypothetical protein [Kingella kingae]MDK4573039.1 hypothetical protein [Kingella kingae]MDK4599099.1 hypothetical protein [Kingella kingae]MDK4617132.1 hypothetical protein [Kingella kingae]